MRCRSLYTARSRREELWIRISFIRSPPTLKRRGAEAHILGCTELSVINRSLPHEARFIDSTEALAYYTIRLCGKTPTGFAPEFDGWTPEVECEA